MIFKYLWMILKIFFLYLKNNHTKNRYDLTNKCIILNQRKMEKIKLVLSLFITILALNMNAQRNANDGISLAQKSINDGISLAQNADGISLAQRNANDGISLAQKLNGISPAQKEESLLQFLWLKIMSN